ncbi:hypothetical protein [Sphingomonas sp.]|uniref:hypothetical protein n=1 Tax=Sphingomonas sp. TaxID=28214 RepID=UPI001EB9257C|nr:hypothetical protein [Sphingomonas sp.]MBX3594061.1 hypothetical protein [Sphingomonas sp.]
MRYAIFWAALTGLAIPVATLAGQSGGDAAASSRPWLRPIELRPGEYVVTTLDGCKAIYDGSLNPDRANGLSQKRWAGACRFGYVDQSGVMYDKAGSQDFSFHLGKEVLKPDERWAWSRAFTPEYRVKYLQSWEKSLPEFIQRTDRSFTATVFGANTVSAFEKYEYTPGRVEFHSLAVGFAACPEKAERAALKTYPTVFRKTFLEKGAAQRILSGCSANYPDAVTLPGIVTGHRFGNIDGQGRIAWQDVGIDTAITFHPCAGTLVSKCLDEVAPVLAAWRAEFAELKAQEAQNLANELTEMDTRFAGNQAAYDARLRALRARPQIGGAQ